MSFGFSVGDLISAANLTYRLIKALHGSHDAGEEYRDAINELGAVQQALIRVSCLGSSKNFPQATFESASCIVMGSMDIIQAFLDRTKKYDRRLGGLASSGFTQGLRKMGWTLFKAEEMKKLRETLHARVAALGMLLAAANLEVEGTAARYLETSEQSNTQAVDTRFNSLESSSKSSDFPKQDTIEGRLPDQRERKLTKSVDSGIGSEDGSSGEKSLRLEYDAEENQAFSLAKPPSLTVISLSSFSREELVSIIADQGSREEKIKDISVLLRTLILMGEYQLDATKHHRLIQLLDSICGERQRPRTGLPIKFKDAVGRNFTFPWHLCNTWKGMEELINQAFLHVDVIGPHVYEGHFDLLGPDGEIILPQTWEATVQPDWMITMHMWPMPEPSPSLQPFHNMHSSASKSTDSTLPPLLPSPSDQTQVHALSAPLTSYTSLLRSPPLLPLARPRNMVSGELLSTPQSTRKSEKGRRKTSSRRQVVPDDFTDSAGDISDVSDI